MPTDRTTVHTDSAPAAIGPYSHAVRAGALIFCSGQIPLNPSGEELVGDTPAEQASQCLRNLEEVARAAGARLADAVRLTVYTTDLGAFAEINEAYAVFFPGDHPPARAAVGVAALPRGAQVEIDAILLAPQAWVLLKACINGARRRGDHPALPLSADECARDAAACVAAGAGAIHLHPRDQDGRETLLPGTIDEAVEAVREAAGVPVGVSTGAWIEPDLASRVAAVHSWAEPDFASVNLSEPGALEVMAALVDRGIEIEAGLAAPEEVERLVTGGMSEGLLRVLIEPTGETTTEQLATAQAIDEALDTQDVIAPRLAHGTGTATWAVLEWGAAQGHDLRIGLEDTLTMADGTNAESNKTLTTAAAELLR